MAPPPMAKPQIAATVTSLVRTPFTWTPFVEEWRPSMRAATQTAPRASRALTERACPLEAGVDPVSRTAEASSSGRERKVPVVPRTGPAYPPEFRREAIELLRQGRTPGELVRAWRVAAALTNWHRQDQRDRHERHDGVTSGEREELARLRREKPAPASSAPAAAASRGPPRP